MESTVREGALEMEFLSFQSQAKLVTTTFFFTHQWTIGQEVTNVMVFNPQNPNLVSKNTKKIGIAVRIGPERA